MNAGMNSDFEAEINFLSFELGGLGPEPKILADVPAGMQAALAKAMPNAFVRFHSTAELSIVAAEHFDVVVLVGALESADEKRDNFFQVLMHAKRALRPGGRLLIVTAGMAQPRTARVKWRFTVASLGILLQDLVGVGIHGDETGRVIMAIGRKKDAVNPETGTAKNEELVNA